DAEQREEINGDLRRVNSLRFASAQERGFSTAIRRHEFEDMVLFGPLLEVGIEDPIESLPGSVLALMDTFNQDQPIGGSEGQWPDENTIHDAEDGGVGADAQRQREHGHDGEAG